MSINDYTTCFFLKCCIWMICVIWRWFADGEVDVSQEPRVKRLATHCALVLKDTGIKKKYYFIKSHSTVSLALVTNVFFSEKPVSFWRSSKRCVYCEINSTAQSSSNLWSRNALEILHYWQNNSGSFVNVLCLVTAKWSFQSCAHVNYWWGTLTGVEVLMFYRIMFYSPTLFKNAFIM